MDCLLVSTVFANKTNAETNPFLEIWPNEIRRLVSTMALFYITKMNNVNADTR